MALIGGVTFSFGQGRPQSVFFYFLVSQHKTKTNQKVIIINFNRLNKLKLSIFIVQFKTFPEICIYCNFNLNWAKKSISGCCIMNAS